MSQDIEVYEWPEGESRPGAEDRLTALDILAVPSDGQAPQIGDVVHIQMPGDPMANNLGLVAFVVIERELLWGPRPQGDNSQNPVRWSKMWIHVRRLSAYRDRAIISPSGE